MMQKNKATWTVDGSLWLVWFGLYAICYAMEGILVGLKLNGTIAWSWEWVHSPPIIPMLAFIALFVYTAVNVLRQRTSQ